ncbi:MAG: hypothetical protein LWX83_18650 [Anaerolineae bacterium]|nr:hypothetical protein [Anaerolineae bacterium]
MRSGIKWGLVMGAIAFLLNLLIPGCFEPFVAFAAAFMAGTLAVKYAFETSRSKRLFSGIAAGISSGLIIVLTDLFSTGILIWAYLNKGRLPWVKLPDFPEFLSNAAGVMVILGLIFAFMTILKLLFTLFGGICGAMLAKKKTD